VIATDVTEAPGCRRLDVTSEQDWADLAAELREAYGQVHGLVNNAGITWRARLGDVRAEDFDRVHSVNVTGPLLGIQHLAPLMPPGSSIVNVGSSAALTAHYPVAYTASKWGLRGLSRVAALELGPRGIRVNTIHPGYIDTEMTASAARRIPKMGARLASKAMERYAAGDDSAFDELYDLLEPLLSAYLHRQIRDNEHAEDLQQQTLLQIHRARSQFIPGADVTPWVLAIARRLIIDSARSSHRDRVLTDVDVTQVAIRGAGADDRVHARQLALQIDAELGALPEPQRVVFVLLKRNGLSLAETAHVLGVTVGAVKLRIHRALHTLREALRRMEQIP
jgi:RNA polymerase sigma factor (sigma-70 family)